MSTMEDIIDAIDKSDYSDEEDGRYVWSSG